MRAEIHRWCPRCGEDTMFYNISAEPRHTNNMGEVFLLYLYRCAKCGQEIYLESE